ncbi:MAG: acyl carrier protein [Gammaproteobacteria bacterium]|nr:acyl carrier protein [Gammaproteobacteria bacterium]
MNATDTVVAVIDIIASSLQLGERARSLTSESRLLGSIPEFDSMAVVVVVTSLEERFGFAVDDDEIDAEVFQTVGSLADFVERKLA